MKLKSNFITHNSGDIQIMVAAGDTDFHGIVKSNITSAFIIECLKNDCSRQEIIEKMLVKYDADEKIITEDVDKVLDVLRSIDAIEE